MEEPSLVKRTCVVCGKTFTEIKHPKGNKRKFCSHECELLHRREYRRNYFKRRYEEDEEYRENIRKNNSKYGVERRKSLREAFMSAMVERLLATQDEEEVRKILEENFRARSEKYDKNARTLRVSKEGS